MATEQQRRRKKLERERKEFKKEYLVEHVICEVQWDDDCGQMPTVVHEPLNFAKGGVREEGNAVSACDHCHERIHSNPAKAKNLGWLRSIPRLDRGRVS